MPARIFVGMALASGVVAAIAARWIVEPENSFAAELPVDHEPAAVAAAAAYARRDT